MNSVIDAQLELRQWSTIIIPDSWYNEQEAKIIKDFNSIGDSCIFLDYNPNVVEWVKVPD